MLKIIGGKSVENLNVATPQPKISIITRGDISSPALHETNLLNSLGEKRFSQFINQIKESIEDKSNLVQALEGLSAEQRINLNKIFSEIDEEIFDLFLAKVFTLDSLDLIDFIENADKLSFESVIKRINNVAVNFDAKLDKLEELAQFNIYSKLENLYQLDGSDISILEIDPQENKKYGVLKKNFKKALQLLAPENDGDVIQYAFPTHPELKHYHSVYLKRINSNELIAHIYDNEQNIRFPLTGLKKYHSGGDLIDTRYKLNLESGEFMFLSSDNKATKQVDLLNVLEDIYYCLSGNIGATSGRGPFIKDLNTGKVRYVLEEGLTEKQLEALACFEGMRSVG